MRGKVLDCELGSQPMFELIILKERFDRKCRIGRFLPNVSIMNDCY